MIRFFDIVFSFLMIIILSPLFLIVSILNLSTGENKIFYLQKRVGKNNRSFNIIKFATMIDNSINLGSKGFVEKNDWRLLPLGAFLRKTKINELPQLFNVLKGDMSLVGYRPLIEETYSKAKKYNINTDLKGRPGITSIASIYFRDEEVLIANAENKEQFYFNEIFPKKLLLDEWWYLNKSFKYYIYIIVITGLSLFMSLKNLPLSHLKGLPFIDIDILEK